MVMKLAECDIVCNIDADNFTGPSFAKYINGCFQSDENIFLSTYSPDKNIQADVLGRICLKKSDFLLLGGYDECMEYYGFEDYDLINRLELLGLKKTLIDRPTFLNAIKHSDYERISEEKITKLFHSLYVRYINAAKSEIIILLKNRVCLTWKLIDCKSLYSSNPVDAFDDSNYDYEYTLENEKWTEGEWLENEDMILLNTAKNEIKLKKYRNGAILKHFNKPFYSITDKDLITEILLFYSQFLNRNKMKRNLEVDKFMASNNNFGRGTVSKNFENNKEICI